MRIGQSFTAQPLQRTDAPEKKAQNSVTNFFRKVLGVKNSPAEKKQQPYQSEPKVNHHRLRPAERAEYGWRVKRICDANERFEQNVRLDANRAIDTAVGSKIAVQLQRRVTFSDHIG